MLLFLACCGEVLVAEVEAPTSPGVGLRLLLGVLLARRAGPELLEMPRPTTAKASGSSGESPRAAIAELPSGPGERKAEPANLGVRRSDELGEPGARWRLVFRREERSCIAQWIFASDPERTCGPLGCVIEMVWRMMRSGSGAGMSDKLVDR